VQAGPALGALGHPLGDLLVVEHVGVAAGFAVVDAEGVARVEPAEPGLLSSLLSGMALEPPNCGVGDVSTVRR
jgi:hypothetical protein